VLVDMYFYLIAYVAVRGPQRREVRLAGM
jgi:hypothetical protein